MAKTAIADKPQAPPSTELRYTRMWTPDLTLLGDWLLWRLRLRHPHLDERMLMGWLRGQMESNEVMFIRYGRAVGMARIAHRPLDPIPLIEEVFVFIKGRDTDGNIEKDALPEGAAIYVEFKRWAESLGADEIVVERNSDVPREMIKSVFGRVFMRESVYAKIGK